MAEEWTYDLFIFYAEADRDWVNGYLLDALEKAEIRCTCESDFTLGVPGISELERVIRQSRYTLLVISQAYLADDLTRFTDILAQSYGEQVGTWPVIPLTLQEGLQLPPRLKMLGGLQASSSEEWEASLERLCHQLTRPVPSPSPKPTCPYPGMIPFGENDERRFFGRDNEIEELLERLRLNPFLTVIGSSGSGKSSLIFAGLIPKLKQSSLFGTGQWCIRSFRPGTSPLANLQAVLGGDVTALEVRIQQLLSTQPDARRLLLVVDQFEELFTQAGTEATPFQQALLKLIEIPNVYLILTVRADFYADLMGSLLWEKIRSRHFEVLPLDKKGLQEAIVRPAEGVEVYVDPVLVERLVVDAKGEPGVLPLIQETLVLLWEKLERRFLPLKAYELLVLPSTAYGATKTQHRTGLQVAIARRADAALADLETEKKRAIARRIFLRLIQFGEGRPDTRRQQSVNDLRIADDDSPLFDLTLHHLADCRLLTLSGEEDTSRKADIAHEALISGWPTLQQWIAQSKEAEQTRRRLEAKAQDWMNFNKKGGLLDKVELEEVKRLNSSNAAEFEISSDLHELIKVSKQADQVRKIFSVSAIVLITGFAIFAGFQWRNAEIGQINALSEASTSRLLSHQELEAIGKSLQTGEALKQSFWQAVLPDSELRNQVRRTLQKVLYGVKEHNRLQVGSPIAAVAFSPDDQTIATVNLEKGRAQLWKPDGSSIPWPHNGRQVQVASSTNKQKSFPVPVVASSADGQIVALDYMGRLVLGSKGNGLMPISAVAFNPTNKNIVALGAGDRVVLLSLAGDQPLRSLEGHRGQISALAFSRDGKILATANTEAKENNEKIGSVQIWKSDDVTFDGPLLQTLQGDMNNVQMMVAISPDGQMVAASGWYGATLWKSDGTWHKSLEGNGKTRSVNTIIFSPDGKTIATGGNDKKVKLWKRDGTLSKTLIGHSDVVWGVSFSPDSQMVASASNDDTVNLWQIDGILVQTLNGHKDAVRAVAFSHNDKALVASASDDGTVKLWRLDGSSLKALSHNDPVYAVAFNPKEKTIATTNGHGWFTLWNTDGTFRKTDQSQYGPITAVAFSPNGQMIATGAADRTVRIRKSDGTVVNSLKGYEGETNSYEVTGVSFSPDSQSIVTADVGGRVLLFNSSNGTLLGLLHRENYEVFGVAFSPNGQIIASASADGTVKLWKRDGTLLKTLSGHEAPVLKVAFSPDGKTIASAGADKTVKLWNSDDGKPLATLRGHEKAVLGVAFSPNGQIIASASADGTVKLWNRDGTLLKTLSGHEAAVVGVAFTPDGKTIASASYDRTVILWKSEENLDLDLLMRYDCQWAGDYLKNNPNVENNDRHLCDDTLQRK